MIFKKKPEPKRLGVNEFIEQEFYKYVPLQISSIKVSKHFIKSELSEINIDTFVDIDNNLYSQNTMRGNMKVVNTLHKEENNNLGYCTIREVATTWIGIIENNKLEYSIELYSEKLFDTIYEEFINKKNDNFITLKLLKKEEPNKYIDNMYCCRFDVADIIFKEKIDFKK